MDLALEGASFDATLAAGAASSSSPWALALLVGLVFILMLRLLDLNEKEPLWALVMVFLIGAVIGGLAYELIGSKTFELGTLVPAFAREVTKAAAITLAFVALSAIARSRGWSEISGPMDGVVYGAAVGLGMATAIVLVRELTVGSDIVSQVGSGGFGSLWSNTLFGLSEGLFGALIGGGFAYALTARAASARRMYPVAGLAAAILAHAAYLWIARGDSLGDGGSFRTLLAMVLPAAVVASVMIWALRGEKTAIGREFEDEVSSGLVTPDDLVMLQDLRARRARYLALFLDGDFDGWLALRALHNRQVHLAMTKARLRNETELDRQTEVRGQIERLRMSVAELRSNYEDVLGPGIARKARTR